jgi:hypothetical protein
MDVLAPELKSLNEQPRPFSFPTQSNPHHTHPSQHPSHSLISFLLRGRVVVEQPLDPKKQYIFGAHPHGINTWNHFLTVSRCFVCVD